MDTANFMDASYENVHEAEIDEGDIESGCKCGNDDEGSQVIA